MGLSRRQFTKEFKLAAVRRPEQGVSIAEVARALEVNPNVLHRWRREFRHGPGNGVPVQTSLITDGRFAEMLSASVVYSARSISVAISSEEMLPVKSVFTSRHPIAHSTWPSNA
jgi:transposase-like protein